VTTEDGVLLNCQNHVTVNAVNELVQPELFAQEDAISIPKMIASQSTVLLAVQDVDPDQTTFHHPSE
jgi:hypothetical protein